jgi:DUF1365 family protein
MSTKSCIYEGTIRHRRFQPVGHEFDSRVFMMYVDLDELSTVFDKYWLWSTKRPNLAWFRRTDYLDEKSNSLSDSVRTLVRSKFGVTPTGPIRLLTHFRYFGYAINPIVLYYCFNKQEEVEFVVAEVTNTPWREKHAYAFDARQANSSKMKFKARKELHVSPFMEMDIEYLFRMSRPARKLSVQIENHRLSTENGLESETQGPAFDATLTLEHQPLNSANLARVLCRYPLMTAQVFGMIHWQAFRLWIKKLPIQRHPKILSDNSESNPESNANNPNAISEFANYQAPVEKPVL